MPPGDLAACIDGCGAWVTVEAAQLLLQPSELRPSRITSWFRERCNCPMCGVSMTLRGHDMSLFQGCDSHGFWIDDSTITQTNLAHPQHAARVSQMRAAAKALRDELARIAAEERARREAEPHVRAQLEAAEAEARAEAERRAREEAEERARAAREAHRKRVHDVVSHAVERGNLHPIVEHLMRLEDAINSLASRITNAGL